MKKKLTLLFTLMLSLVALFAFNTVGAFADTVPPTWSVTTTSNVSVTHGGNVAISYTLKYGNDVVTDLMKEVDGVKYTVKPYVEIYEEGGTTNIYVNGVISTKDMTTGEKTLILKVFTDSTKTQQLGQDATFKLNVVAPDNTSTIVLIVFAVLLVGWMIWSSRKNKKKQKNAMEKVQALKVGDRVKTIGGVCGFVTEINDAENTFVLEVGQNSFVKFDKQAIYRTAPAEGSAVAQEEVKKEEVKEEIKEDIKD